MCMYFRQRMFVCLEASRTFATKFPFLNLCDSYSHPDHAAWVVEQLEAGARFCESQSYLQSYFTIFSSLALFHRICQYIYIHCLMQ